MSGGAQRQSKSAVPPPTHKRSAPAAAAASDMPPEKRRKLEGELENIVSKLEGPRLQRVVTAVQKRLQELEVAPFVAGKDRAIMLQKVQEFIHNASKDEMQNVWQYARDRDDDFKLAARRAIRIGSMVEWTSSSDGKRLRGRVVKAHGRKFDVVVEGTTWHVPPAMLDVVQS